MTKQYEIEDYDIIGILCEIANEMHTMNENLVAIKQELRTII